MRASSAIGLFLVSSVSIFGIVTGHSPSSTISHSLPPVEPVYVNGQMGVYDPDTGQFVPSTSPLFDQTCERIQQKREQASGYYHSSSTYHHWYYSSSSNSFTYLGAPSLSRSSSNNSPSYAGSSGWSSSSGSTSSGISSSSTGSSRGGIGSTGHSFSGGSAS